MITMTKNEIGFENSIDGNAVCNGGIKMITRKLNKKPNNEPIYDIIKRAKEIGDRDYAIAESSVTKMFEDMIRRIRTVTAKKVLSLQQGKVDVKPIDPVKIISPSPTDKSMRTIKNTDRKVGRNDPCPCGSGKKYKNCCGQDK